MVAADPSELLDLLLQLKMPPHEARVVCALADGASHESGDVRRRAGLSQPQLSRAATVLETSGILARGRREPEGRGRPPDELRLARPLPLILRQCEGRLQARLKQLEQDIAQLQRWRRALLASDPSAGDEGPVTAA